MGREKDSVFIIVAIALLVVVVGVVLYFVLTPPCIALSVEATEAAKVPGQTVMLEVSVADNPGFTDMRAYIDYDHEQLQLVSIEDSYKSMDGGMTAYLPDAAIETDYVEFEGREVGYIKISSAGPIKEKQLRLFAITFKIRPEAGVGVATVSVFGEQFFCKKKDELKPIGSAVQSGGILVGKTTCRHTDEGKDLFCDLCGVQIASVEKVDIETAYISVENGIRMNFAIASELPRGKGYQAFMTKRGIGGARELSVMFDQWEQTGDGYVISFPLRSIDLGEQISIEIENEEGYLYNNPYEVCPRDLVMEKLRDAAVSDEEKTMYVDLLNFGAAAQTFYRYAEDAPVNSALEEAHQAMATQTVRLEDSSVRGENYMGASLSMKDRMDLSVYFEGFYGKRIIAMYAEAVYTDHAGNEQKIRIPGSDLISYGDGHGDQYQVYLKGLQIADAFAPIEVTVYNEDGSVHGSGTESVASLCARVLQSEPDASAIYAEFLKLAASTKNYLLSK